MKKVKTNPIMMEQKKLKRINNGATSDEGNEIKSFIIIVIVIAALVGTIYGLTELLKKDDKNEPTKTVGKINYDRVSIGNMLNRPYEEYYVLIYNSNDTKAILYSTLMTNYMQKSSESNYLKIYFCDLDNSLNSKYYNINNDNRSNKEAKDITELDLGDLTLIKVKKGKIVSYIEDYDKIVDILK